ncbi:uncharacterized protein PgNI_01055, partial [Pyricularia grisea]|uniref:NWD NACHT-NTPase N-terminal domain-containing protein n=1 Tax=Pyricularia grisea TaxID=148305 RepID=A0A6P8BKK3_PYRGI
FNAPDIFFLLDLSTSVVERTLQYRCAPHSIMGLFGRKANPSGAPSSSGKQSSRWKTWSRKSGGSNKNSPAQNDCEVSNVSIVTGSISPPRDVDEAEVTNASNTATSAELLPSKSCPTNNKPIPNDGGATADSTSSWDLAYEALREEKPEIVQAYEELLSKTSSYLEKTSSTADLNDILSKASNDRAKPFHASDTEIVKQKVQSDTSSRRTMENIIVMGQKHMEGRQIAFKVGTQKLVLQDQMQHLVTGIQFGKDWIDKAVQASPMASTAWAGVCLLLPLLINPAVVDQANKEGFAYVTQKIQYYTDMESFFLHGNEQIFPAKAKHHLRKLFIELYKAIIDFQAQSVLRFFRSRFSTFVRDIAKWDSWEEMLQKVKGLVRAVDDSSQQINATATKAALGELVQMTREAEEDKCLQALRRGDYVWYKERVQSRVSDTCSWFLNHESYQSWLAAESGPLLVSADPGCGKSVLAKYLIDSKFNFRLSKDAAICYFFFRDPDQNTIELALCALVHQLLCLRPQLMRHALARYKQDGAKLADNTTALWNVLESASADPEAGTVLIVLDALDECRQDERNMATLSRFIHEHFHKARPKSLKILLTSRPYQGTIQHIQKLENSFPNIRIKGEDDSETISEEINAVIEHRVNQIHNLDTTLKKHLEERLKGIKHRTYLWLYLVLHHLEETTFKRTLRGIDSAIQTLPATVNEAYEKILSRSSDPAKARKTVLILLAAYRPLTLHEMQIAVGLRMDTLCLGDLDMESDESFGERLRQLCGLFITVHDKRVYFLHQTAREFLLPIAVCMPGPTITRTWAHTLDICQAHAVLAESSSYFGHEGVVRMLLDTRKVDVDAKDGNGRMSLSWAAEEGHKTVVRMLLDTGKADVDAKSKIGRTPLSWAAAKGHEAVVQMLLDTGKVEVDAKDEEGRTPLSWAAEGGHETVVRMLLDTRKVDVDAKSKIGRTPLLWAAEGGHEAVVQMLLDTRKVEVDAKSKNSRTPLSWAAAKGHEIVVRMLLDTHKVDVDAKDGNGRTPLLRAAEEGHETVVRMLLDTGKVDVDAKDDEGGTPLLWAAARGHEAVVRMLHDIIDHRRFSALEGQEIYTSLCKKEKNHKTPKTFRYLWMLVTRRLASEKVTGFILLQLIFFEVSALDFSFAFLVVAGIKGHLYENSSASSPPLFSRGRLNVTNSSPYRLYRGYSDVG